MVPQSLRWGRKQLANILHNKSVPLKLEKFIIINIFMAILVTTLCERANDHGGCRRPTSALWPHSRCRGTLQSANILQNKFTLLNLENIIVIYTIMTIKDTACCAWHLAIWSKTFELDHLAIACYLVEIDQWSLKGVRKMYPASTK
jgi:hypothetical protein